MTRSPRIDLATCQWPMTVSLPQHSYIPVCRETKPPTFRAKWTDSIFIQCELLIQCVVSHVPVEGITASKVQQGAVILIMGNQSATESHYYQYQLTSHMHRSVDSETILHTMTDRVKLPQA